MTSERESWETQEGGAEEVPLTSPPVEEPRRSGGDEADQADRDDDGGDAVEEAEEERPTEPEEDATGGTH